jgi:signal transduction histidine kinase
MGSAIGSTPLLPPDPLRLRRRLLLQGGSFALLLLLAFSASLYWGIVRQRDEDQRLELRQLAAGAASQLPLILHEVRESEGPLKFRGQPGVGLLPGLEQQRVQWFDAAGTLLRQQGALPVPAVRLQGEPHRPRTLGWQRWPGGIALMMPVHSIPEPRRQPEQADGALVGYVRVSLSDQRARQDLERLQRGLLLGAVVAALAALLVGRRMLAAAFAPLQRQVDALQRFSADASHELRHPLTAMRAVLAGVPEAWRDQAELGWHQLDALARRQSDLLDDLLLLARLEQGGVTALSLSERPLHFDLLELLEDLIACHHDPASQRRVALQLTPAPESACLPVCGNPEQLKRLFTNLLLNAIRHSPEGGVVRVEASAAAQRLRILVVDAGPGIAPQAREQVFERFWRGGDEGGQTGLGLAIARSIARRHGGELKVGDSRPGRCVLIVELPRTGPLS